MTTSMIFLSIITLGLSCGLGCGSVTTPFLLGKLLGEGKDTKESMKAVGLFSVGKILVLSLLGMFAALLGIVVLDTIESIYPTSIVWITRVMTFLFGLVIIVSVFRKTNCGNCRNCTSKKIKIFDHTSYFVAGILYAIIPCTPLMTALTYANTMTPILGFLLLLTFGITNSIIPVLIYSPIIGTVNFKVLTDIYKFSKGLKLFGGLLLMGLVFFL